MKLNKLLLGVLAAGMFGACSSDNVPDGPGNEPGKGFEGDGYMSVSIAFPQESATRADGPGNGNFADGAASEYAVENAAIALFTKAANVDESDAKFLGVYEVVGNFQNDPVADNNVTATKTIVINSDDLKTVFEDENAQLYGLALINWSSVFEINFANGRAISMTKKAGANAAEGSTLNALTINTNSTFGELLNSETNTPLYTTGTGDAAGSEFFMTNAILSTLAGGATDPASGKIFTLALLDKKAIKDTREEAMKAPAGCIFVERAVAKVTTTGISEVTIGGVKFSVEIQHVIDNTEPTSYVVRNAKTGDDGVADFAWNLKAKQPVVAPATSNDYDYRMIGWKAMTSSIDGDHANHFRTYWCQDPGKDGYGKNDSDRKLVSAATNNNDGAVYQFLNMAKPLYCYENTFSVENQNHGNTTRVIYKVTLTPVKGQNESAEKTPNLFILNQQRDKIYTQSSLENYYMNLILAETGYLAGKEGQDEVLGELYAALKAIAAETHKGEDNYSYTKVNAKDLLNIEFDANKGEIKTLSLNNNDDFKAVFGASTSVIDAVAKLKDNGIDLETIATKVNSIDEVTTYNGGVSYYEVYVKHFGQYGTWLDEDNVAGTLTNEVYKGSAADYLGRYGMVRNNWYEINVDGITGIGTVTPPSIDFDLSDDNKVKNVYLMARIHILSWCKRTQGVTFH